MGLNKAAYFLSLFGWIVGSENKQLHGYIYSLHFLQ
jgi:hypothetical protein